MCTATTFDLLRLLLAGTTRALLTLLPMYTPLPATLAMGNDQSAVVHWAEKTGGEGRTGQAAGRGGGKKGERSIAMH